MSGASSLSPAARSSGPISDPSTQRRKPRGTSHNYHVRVFGSCPRLVGGQAMAHDGDGDAARLSLTVDSDRCVAFLSGEIDLSNAAGLFGDIRTAADGARPVVVDLTRVTFLDSSG